MSGLEWLKSCDRPALELLLTLFTIKGATRLIGVLLTQGPCLACLGSVEHIPRLIYTMKPIIATEGQTI